MSIQINAGIAAVELPHAYRSDKQLITTATPREYYPEFNIRDDIADGGVKGKGDENRRGVEGKREREGTAVRDGERHSCG